MRVPDALHGRNILFFFPNSRRASAVRSTSNVQALTVTARLVARTATTSDNAADRRLLRFHDDATGARSSVACQRRRAERERLLRTRSETRGRRSRALCAADGPRDAFGPCECGDVCLSRRGVRIGTLTTAGPRCTRHVVVVVVGDACRPVGESVSENSRRGRFWLVTRDDTRGRRRGYDRGNARFSHFFLESFSPFAASSARVSPVVAEQRRFARKPVSVISRSFASAVPSS